MNSMKEKQTEKVLSTFLLQFCLKTIRVTETISTWVIHKTKQLAPILFHFKYFFLSFGGFLFFCCFFFFQYKLKQINKQPGMHAHSETVSLQDHLDSYWFIHWRKSTTVRHIKPKFYTFLYMSAVTFHFVYNSAVSIYIHLESIREKKRLR